MTGVGGLGRVGVSSGSEKKASMGFGHKLWIRGVAGGVAVCLGLATLTRAETATVNRASWTYDVDEEGRATVTGGPNKGDVVIPEMLGGHPVAAIGEKAFSMCSEVSSMTIPDSVENIGALAFFGCDGLEKFSVGENNQAFAVAEGVLFSKDMKTLLCFPGGKGRTWAVPEGTAEIGSYAFVHCELLESLELPQSLEKLGDCAFYMDFKLTMLDLPDNVSSLGERAFYGCTNLVEVGIGAGATNVTGGLFEGCTGIQRFRVAEDNPVVSAQDGVLFSKDGKTLVCFPAGRSGVAVVPDGVERIGNSAFFLCLNLQSVTLPDGLKELGDHAFSDCEALKTVVLPDGVERIGSWAFYYCRKLESVEIPGTVTEIGDHAFAACYALTSVSIPPRLTEIKPNTFDWCSSLSSVEIPFGVTNIGTEAFSYCKAMTMLTIPDSVVEIGSCAFIYANKLVTVQIGKGVKSIGIGTFEGCDALAWLVVPESVESVGRSAFNHCGNLKTLWVPASWEGTSMLEGTSLSGDCQVIYRMPEPMEARYGWWLAEYGKTPGEMPEDGDEDGDGAKNGEEFVAGTNPLDAGERFEVNLRKVDGKWVAEALPERTGRMYKVLGTTELPSVGEAVWEDASGADDLSKTEWRFFRLEAEWAETD